MATLLGLCALALLAALAQLREETRGEVPAAALLPAPPPGRPSGESKHNGREGDAIPHGEDELAHLTPDGARALAAYQKWQLHRPGVECRVVPPLTLGEIGDEAHVIPEEGVAGADNTLVAGVLLVSTPPGQGSFVVDIEGYEPAVVEWVREPDQEVGMCRPDPIRLEPVVATLFGLVRKGEQPAVGAHVTGCGSSTRTRTDGSWIMSVSPGLCTVRAWWEVDGVTSAGPVVAIALEPGQDREVRLDIPEGPPGWAGLALVKSGGAWRVSSVLSAEARRAGVETGDELVLVDDRSLEGLERDEVGLEMAGAPGEPVNLTLRRDGVLVRISLERSAAPVADLFAIGP